MTITQRVVAEAVYLGLAAQQYLYQAFTQDYFPGNGTDLKNDRLAAYLVGRCAAVATESLAKMLPKKMAPSAATCTLLGNGAAIALTPELYSAVAGERRGADAINFGCSDGADPLSKEAIQHCPQGMEDDFPNAVPAATLRMDQVAATFFTSGLPALWNYFRGPEKPILPL